MKTNDLGTRIICALMTLLFAFSVSCADQSEEISQTSIGTSIEDSSEASIESTDEKDEIISYIYDNMKVGNIRYRDEGLPMRHSSRITGDPTKTDLPRDYSYPKLQEGDTITVYGEKYTITDNSFSIGDYYHTGEWPLKFIISVTDKNGNLLEIGYTDVNKPPNQITNMDLWRKDTDKNHKMSTDAAKEVALKYIEEKFNGEYNLGIDIEKYTCTEYNLGYECQFVWELFVNNVKIHQVYVCVIFDYQVARSGYHPLPEYENLEELLNVSDEKYKEIVLDVAKSLFWEDVEIEFKEFDRDYYITYHYGIDFNVLTFMTTFYVTSPDGTKVMYSMDFYVPLCKKQN